MPSAMSSEGEPDEIVGVSSSGFTSPSSMIAPLPNCFSIDETATSMAFCFSAFEGVDGVEGRAMMVLLKELRGESVLDAVLPQRQAGKGDVSCAARGEPALEQGHALHGELERSGRGEALERNRRRLAQARQREMGLVR